LFLEHNLRNQTILAGRIVEGFKYRRENFYQVILKRFMDCGFIIWTSDRDVIKKAIMFFENIFTMKK
jgi:hypothetical protein